jgi:nucleoside-diphosphate-sugar epimerase
LYDTESLRSGAASADAVIHLAYNHDFTKPVEAAAADYAAIEALLEGLGQGKPFIGTTAPIWDTDGKAFVESDVYDISKARTPRGKSELLLKQKATEGFKTAFVRLPPTVHGPNDPNFITRIIDASKKAGKVGYVGDGQHVWASAHLNDVGRLYVATLNGLADGSVPPGQTIHADEAGGFKTKDIAQTIADKLKVEAVSITVQESQDLYTPYIGFVWGANIDLKSDITRKVTGWKPEEVDLLEDLKGDVYIN